ncbi:unnamed protein product [Effrenium voratum]|uniref:Uncharacterized protein n=1 Tax=Effrenium voratum TaxID=2562239 RepID=A0AA36JFF7_9DINO|nr:unnamed protein product [Effrenium voratum]CAJ1404086.1 unnamed protein product [Effrenium voratum]|mmetsp:Transcript_119814/g.284680  ORF Transcript_119814/g.284680 Transcript_119814/m.284680 type:complete len:157 (-) Transcript_119814:99-569(-)|eukprot:CAMPEP_0181470610 /NCGR_PEP_ID=MMETSP1110-20121109/38643_1 /TAXON_ID=174948 /ORGANISM="Symbiodinium sp., Strain CCMP421" /LENGTH=156 /DNA_ID=CAMNT_0023595593 /DNA_START=65 /DNA_END=535 /DNA_ORIENTATION=+
MGLSGSHLHFNRFKDVSPWTTEVIVVNNMQTPALILEATQHHKPSPDSVIEHYVPPGEHAIMSGWLQEPRATLYIRTGLHSAKELKVPNFGRIVISNDPHGLRVETCDEDLSVAEMPAEVAETLAGSDTVPMMLRKESFKDSSKTIRLPKLSMAGA